MILHILSSAFSKTCILQMILYNDVMKDYENAFKIYKYIVMSKLWKIWSHTMYIKDKRENF